MVNSAPGAEAKLIKKRRNKSLHCNSALFTIARKKEMRPSHVFIFSLLIAVLTQQGNSWTPCELVTQTSFTASGTITVNGNSYSVSHTFNELRGYRCRQDPATDADTCDGIHLPDNQLPINSPSVLEETGGLRARVCVPKTVSVVERTETKSLGGTDTSVTFSWANITSCSCNFV